tara:strand:+ start:18560 stop:18940 length:381 start_codon:yes stop_codon:yes gene_type:complete
MKDEKENAVWNTKYFPDEHGRCRKISDMSMNQTNKALKTINVRMKTCMLHLERLYQRRFVLKQQSGEEDYTVKNHKQKIIKNLGLKTELEKNEHMQQILLTALGFIESGKDLSLIKAILEQARDEL